MSSHAEATDSGSSIKVLETHNYHHWSDLMLSYFLEHNLDGIVDGTEAQPINSPAESQNWLLRQKKAAGFIARKLDSSSLTELEETLTLSGKPSSWNTRPPRLGTALDFSRDSFLLTVQMEICPNTPLLFKKLFERWRMLASNLTMTY